MRRQRLLEPRECERLERAQPSARLSDIPRHVGVDHQLAVVADRLPDGANAIDVLAQRLAHLHLQCPEAPSPVVAHLLDELRRRQREVDGAGIRREGRAVNAEVAVEREPGVNGKRIPQGDVRSRDRHGCHAARADEVELRVQLAPDRLDVARVAAEQLRHDRVLEQRVDRGAAVAHGIREAEPLRPVVGLDLERHELDVGDLVEAGADPAAGPPHLTRDAVVRRPARHDPHGSDSANASISEAPLRTPNSSS